MIILAIDPGPQQSAWLAFDTETGRPIEWAKEPNADIRLRIIDVDYDQFAIEVIASYGMPVGAETFETCIEIGRFIEAWESTGSMDAIRIYRKDVKMHLCGSVRAKDGNVRQALIDRYGPGKEIAIGRKASPGVLYGMSGDCWSALGVAATAQVRLSP